MHSTVLVLHVAPGIGLMRLQWATMLGAKLLGRSERCGWRRAGLELLVAHRSRVVGEALAAGIAKCLQRTSM